MAIMIDSSETAEADGEGQDGSDKPPHDDIHSKSVAYNGIDGSVISASAAGSQKLATTKQPPGPPGLLAIKADNHNVLPDDGKFSVPLPPPETGARPKEPGHTKRSLSSLVASHEPAYVAPEMMSAIASSSGSDSDGWSASGPSTRPPSQAPSRASSRAPSMSFGKSGSKVVTDTTGKPIVDKLVTPQAPSSPTPKPDRTSTSTIKPKESPSIQSYGEGQKFTLKELLANGPKLNRKSSVRSTASSKKSDSDGAKSTAESTGSLLKKYGVCGRVAIGKGATSVVRLAHKWDRTEEKLYAVKEFRKRRKNETEKEYVKKLTAEFCISSTLHHANIVETVDLVQDENQHWCEVMEFCPGGDLYGAIKKGGMSTNEVECCFKQILNGVAYLHSQGVAHRDIKPENLFFDARGQLKIGDYGASTVYRLPWESTVHMSTGLCGSEPYIAPEQFTMKPYDARLVDIWACGVVFYCLHFQELPWRVAQVSDPLYAAYATACASSPSSQSSFPPTINNLTPRSCRPLIRRMLDPDPKTRWLIEDIIAHSWVQSIEVCHLVTKPTHVHVHAISLAQSPPT